MSNFLKKVTDATAQIAKVNPDAEIKAQGIPSNNFLSSTFKNIGQSVKGDPLGTALNVGRAISGDPSGLIGQASKAANVPGLSSLPSISSDGINTDNLLNSAKDYGLDYLKNKVSQSNSQNKDTDISNTTPNSTITQNNNSQNISLKNPYDPEKFRTDKIDTDRLGLLKNKLGLF